MYTKNTNNLNYVLVVGNGLSRKNINLESLLAPKTIGCNALYRDFHPDILISVDEKISEEIQLSGYSRNNIHYTRNPLPGSGARKIDTCYGFSSGPIAVAYACKMNPQQIFLLGFDFYSSDGLINNVYAGTNGYKSPHSAETFYGNWVNQLFTIIQTNGHIDFYRVSHPPYNKIPEKLQQCMNFHQIATQDFLAKYSITSEVKNDSNQTNII